MYVKTMQIQYTNDGMQWETLENGKNFEANKDMKEVKLIKFEKPFLARTVRIKPTAWNRWIAMRVELYFKNFITNDDAGGLSSRSLQIPSARIPAKHPLQTIDPSYSTAKNMNEAKNEPMGTPGGPDNLISLNKVDVVEPTKSGVDDDQNNQI